MNKLLPLLLACLTSAAMAAGSAANPDQEISTALQHAGMSAGSTTIDNVHMHLHHVINCLVGPSGKGFDSTAENPCMGQGTGALNDVGDMGKQRAKLEEAVKDAQKGLSENDLKKAQIDAKQVMQDLQDAQKVK